MTTLDPDRLRAQLRRGPRPGVYVLLGEDAFAAERVVAALVDAHLEPTTRAFNLETLRGSDVDPEDLAVRLATPPWMATHRVVVVREAHALAPKARETIAQWAARAPSDVVLVLWTLEDSARARDLGKLAPNITTLVECTALTPDDAPGWAMTWAEAEHGRRLDPEAARALVAAVGPDARLLATEIAKLVDFVGDRSVIALTDVEAVGIHLPRIDRWQWLDLVGRRRWTEARRQLPDLLAQGESATGLVAALTTHALRLGLAQSGGAGALERELKPHQRWLARRLLDQARLWTEAELQDLLVELLRTDVLLKSAVVDEAAALDLLLLRLHGRTMPRAA